MTTFDKNAIEYIYNLRKQIFQDNLEFNVKKYLRENCDKIVCCCHMSAEQQIYFKNGYYHSIEKDDYSFFKNGKLGNVILLNIKRHLIDNIYNIISCTDTAEFYTIEEKREMARMIENFVETM